MAKTLNVNGTQMANVTANGVSMNRVYMNGVLVFEKTTPVTDELTISPTLKTVSSSSQNYDIAVTSNTTWTASEGLTWVEFVGLPSGSQNGIVTVSVDPNSSTSDRSGDITFTTGSQSGSVTETHTLTQQPTPPPFNEGELNEHTVSNSSTSSGACSGSINKTVYSQSIDFSSSSILYNESNGATRANAGFYSKDSSVLECNSSGVVTSSGFCGGGGF